MYILLKTYYYYSYYNIIILNKLNIIIVDYILKYLALNFYNNI